MYHNLIGGFNFQWFETCWLKLWRMPLLAANRASSEYLFEHQFWEWSLNAIEIKLFLNFLDCKSVGEIYIIIFQQNCHHPEESFSISIYCRDSMNLVHLVPVRKENFDRWVRIMLNELFDIEILACRHISTNVQHFLWNLLFRKLSSKQFSGWVWNNLNQLIVSACQFTRSSTIPIFLRTHWSFSTQLTLCE